MEIYDIIVLLLVIGGAFLGWRKGLASQVASILSIGVSYFVAVNFRGAVAQHIDAAPPWNTFAAMLLLYIGTSIVIWMIFRQINSTIKALKLKDFDYHMGALFGAAKGFIIACVATLFAITLLHEEQRQTIIHSRSGNVIAHFLHRAKPIMPLEVQNFLEPYIERLDQELQLERAGYHLGQDGFPPVPAPSSSGQPQYQPGQYGGSETNYGIPPAYGGNPSYSGGQYGQGGTPTYGGGSNSGYESGPGNPPGSPNYLAPGSTPWNPQPTTTPSPSNPR